MSGAHCPVFGVAEGSNEDTYEGDDEASNGREETMPKDRLVVSADVSDMDYLKSRMTKALAVDEDEEDDGVYEAAQAS